MCTEIERSNSIGRAALAETMGALARRHDARVRELHEAINREVERRREAERRLAAALAPQPGERLVPTCIGMMPVTEASMGRLSDALVRATSGESARPEVLRHDG